MPTPVGPAPRDPNDPDFWDWDPPDGEPIRRRPALAAVAAVVLVALVLLLVVNAL